MTDYLKVCVKQGEELDIPFTLKENSIPMDLTEYNIRFQVKKVPLADKPSMIDKTINSSSNENEVGIINNPTGGEFKIHLLEEDTSYPVGEYSLIISLEGENYIDIISSDCCNKAIYKICEQ